MLVYCLFNTINEKYYVGQTVQSIAKRIKGHIEKANAGRKDMMICKAIIKHGPSAFQPQLLGEYPSQEELDNAERLWIILLSATDKRYGYNAIHGGKGQGKRTTEERIAIGNALRGRKATEAQMKGLRVGWALGFRPTGPMSEEGKAKIKLANTGRVKSAQECAKISAGKKGKPMHPNALANLRKGPGSADPEKLRTAQRLRRQRERDAK
jgi:group I intron endonuclease